MSPRRPIDKTGPDAARIGARIGAAVDAGVDEAGIVRDLKTIRDGAMDGEAWAPALRAVELLGRHIGMWRNEPEIAPVESLADMINRAASLVQAEEERQRR